MKEDMTLNSNKLESPSTQNALRQDWLTSPAVLKQKKKNEKTLPQRKHLSLWLRWAKYYRNIPFWKKSSKWLSVFFYQHIETILLKKLFCISLYLIVRFTFSIGSTSIKSLILISLKTGFIIWNHSYQYELQSVFISIYIEEALFYPISLITRVQVAS